MELDGTIATYFPWVDKVVDAIRGLGDIVNKIGIVDKVLITLPKIFDSILSVLIRHSRKKPHYKIP